MAVVKERIPLLFSSISRVISLHTTLQYSPPLFSDNDTHDSLCLAEIGDEGAKVVAEALKHNSTLKEI